MPERNTWRQGRWLVIDDESGLTHYSDEVVRLWDGSYRRIDQYETRHPQEFVRAGSDPFPIPFARPDPPSAAALTPNIFVGVTTVSTPTGPATHLFNMAIPDMEIGSSFIIR